MFKAFVLLATVWNSPAESTRPFDTYVIDHELTGEDCIYLLQEVYESDGYEVSPGKVLSTKDFTLSCEIDAEFED